MCVCYKYERQLLGASSLALTLHPGIEPRSSGLYSKHLYPLRLSDKTITHPLGSNTKTPERCDQGGRTWFLPSVATALPPSTGISTECGQQRGQTRSLKVPGGWVSQRSLETQGKDAELGGWSQRLNRELRNGDNECKQLLLELGY